MRLLLILSLAIFVLLQSITCPPVNPNQPKVAEGGSEDDDTGLEYDKYLREVVTVLEEDEGFKKKLEEANISDIKSGKIATHLEMVSHHIREKLDEIKRKEVDRLRMLAREKIRAMKGAHGFDERVLHHLDVENPHTFEMKDLEKLIKKATSDLDELDKKRRQDFKTYEMEKEHERREHLKQLPEEDRKKKEQKYEELKKKHKDHPKLHHPGSKDQLKEVWEEKDHMDPDTFDPKTFFNTHDLNGDGYLDYSEVESLFNKELDKVYDPNNPEEDDMEERYEEMNRMREHVMKEIDKDHDGMVSKQEFLEYSHTKEFDKDEGWDTLDEQEVYNEDDLREYEKMLAEEEARRQQQGAFGHAQPGVVMHPQDPNMQHMNQQGYPPVKHMQGMGPPGHMQGMPPQHMQGMPPQHMQGMPPQQHMQGMPQQQMHGMQQGMPQGQGMPQQQQGHYGQDQLKFVPQDQLQQQQQQQQYHQQMQQQAAQQQAAQAAHQQAIQNAQAQGQQPVQQQQHVQQQAQVPQQQQQAHVQQQQQQGQPQAQQQAQAQPQQVQAQQQQAQVQQQQAQAQQQQAQAQQQQAQAQPQQGQAQQQQTGQDNKPVV